MKQNAIYLAKGLLFSFITFAVLFFFLAFLMFQNEWNDTIMRTLLYVSVCLSTFLGSFYFSKHAPARKFLWGIFFGIIFWSIYLLAAFLLGGPDNFSTDRIFIVLAFTLLAGMAGGMCSQLSLFSCRILCYTDLCVIRQRLKLYGMAVERG